MSFLNFWPALGQVAILLMALAACYVPLGDYMARSYTSAHDNRAEKWIYRALSIDSRRTQTWVGYARSVIVFSAASVVLLYAILRLQGVLPSLGNHHSGLGAAMAFNTAVSFVTNTNWQSYSGEVALTNLSQMAGLTVQNFVSAAVGMAVAVALVRGIIHNRNQEVPAIGNFWVDLTRGLIRILLPLALVGAILLAAQGVIQSFAGSVHITGFTGKDGQDIALYPTASQEAIKLLGTNGGGIYGANSAHPFENPNPFSNVMEVFFLLLIPVCLTRTYGTMVRDQKQGLTLLGVIAVLWGAILTVVTCAQAHVTGAAAEAAGGYAEGFEQRFGSAASALFAVSTTGTSTGAVDSAHDSFSAAGGGGLILNMLLGEIAPGGVGSGLYGLLLVAILSVFLGGLLVGRTPEFLGSTIGRREMTCVSLAILVMPALVLVGAAISVILPGTTEAMANSGEAGTPDSIHGFSEVLYAFSSAANNNGSAFAGLTVTSDWFQSALGIAMLLGRLLPIIFVLALAGSLCRQRTVATSAGTLPTAGVTFGALVVGVVILVAALTFFPALSLGPIAEALS